MALQARRTKQKPAGVPLAGGNEMDLADVLRNMLEAHIEVWGELTHDQKSWLKTEFEKALGKALYMVDTEEPKPETT